MAEVAIGLRSQIEEFVQAADDARKAHHGQRREIDMQLATGPLHQRTAEADELDVGAQSGQGAYEVRAVEIAAWFADGEENAHEEMLNVRMLNADRRKYAKARQLGEDRLRRSSAGSAFDHSTLSVPDCS